MKQTKKTNQAKRTNQSKQTRQAKQYQQQTPPANETKSNLYKLLPVLFALCIIPLVVLTHDYETAFSSYDWFNNQELSQIDSFEYAKGILVVIAGVVAALALVIHEYSKHQKKKKLLENRDIKVTVLWGVYLLMVLISAFFSQYTDLVFTGGGYGQWQTVWVLCAYGALFMYAYTFIDTENRGLFTIKCMMVTTGILSLLGFLQTIGHNPLKWGWVQSIMTSQSSTEAISFKDGVSSVILTFNNPNYVGPYVALVFPLVIAFIFVKASKNKMVSIVCRIASVLIAAGFVATLKGSDSSASMIATAAGVLFIAVLWLIGLLFGKKEEPVEESDDVAEDVVETASGKNKSRKTAMIVVICVIVVLGAGITYVTQSGLLGTVANKVLEGSEDTRNIGSIVNTKKDELQVTLRNDTEFTLSPTMDASGKIIFQARDSKDVEIPVVASTEANTYTLADDRLQMIRLTVNNFSVNDNLYSGFVFHDAPNSISWTFMYVDGKWNYYTPFGKFIRLRKVESFGFEDYQNIANRRGFIWSRTIPCMKDCWFNGVGPNAFIMAFPNDDFVGSKRVGNSTTLVDKPHNAFLQIFIQTGGISALAYIGLWLLYMISGVRLFWRKKHYSDLEKLGLGLLGGIFAFAIAGITNDTIIGSQNIYWILLGTGYAINRIIQTKR